MSGGSFRSHPGEAPLRLKRVPPSRCGPIGTCFRGLSTFEDIGLARATDAAIWRYARDHDLTIISKDSDFHQMSFLRGAPPKVIWIRRGNCTTDEIEALLRSKRAEILAFGAEARAAFLALS